MLHGGNHTSGDHLFTYSASHKDTAVGTKNRKYGLTRPKDRFHRSNVHCSCFLAQASFFILLVPFSSGFFAAFDHEGLIHAVSSEQLMLRCACYLNSVKHLFVVQFLRLVTLMNKSSAAEATLVLMSSLLFYKNSTKIKNIPGMSRCV